mgnify:CR=1 FL=1
MEHHRTLYKHNSPHAFNPSLNTMNYYQYYEMLWNAMKCYKECIKVDNAL